jgi:hypothetical protein
MMRRAFVFIASCVAVGAGLRLAAGCLEFSPIVVERETVVDSGRACLTCVKGDAGCAQNVETCLAKPRCAPIFACIETNDCFERLTIGDKIQCGLPCAVDAGITNVDDPIVQVDLVAMITCAQTSCAAVCGEADGGPEP